MANSGQPGQKPPFLGVVFLQQIATAIIYYSCILQKKDFVVNQEKPRHWRGF
jgi:hypothetical protein